MTRPRILAIAPTYLPRVGGTEKALHELFAGVTDEFEVDLVVPDFGGPRVERVGLLTIYRTCRPTRLQTRRAPLFVADVLATLHRLGARSYDLIHCHYLFPSGLAGLVLRRRLGAPMVVTEHHFGMGLEICSEQELPRPLVPVLRFVARRADVLVVTGRAQGQFLQWLGRDRLRYRTIHLGGDCAVSGRPKDQLHRDLGLAGKKVVLSVSRLVGRKDIMELLRAAGRVARDRADVVFCIVGTGADREPLERRIRECGLSTTVRLLGLLSEPRLAEYRKAADVFVSTSRYEGAGLVYLEALAAGLPLFARSNVAVREAITDGVDGRLFDDAQGLADLIVRWIDDEPELRRLAANGRATHRARYTWRQHGDAHKQLYRDVIQASRRRAGELDRKGWHAVE